MFMAKISLLTAKLATGFFFRSSDKSLRDETRSRDLSDLVQDALRQLVEYNPLKTFKNLYLISIHPNLQAAAYLEYKKSKQDGSLYA